MKVKNIKDAAKKKATKTGKVIDIKKAAKKAEVSSEKLTLQDVRAIAEKMGIDAGNLNKTELIRAIQRAEGYNDCYMTVQVLTCGETDCLWHQDCALC